MQDRFSFLLVVSIADFELQPHLCIGALILFHSMQLPGSLGLLAVVCENVYKTLYPTRLYTLCGKKMSLVVIAITWVFSVLWCFLFWFAELRYVVNYRCVDSSQGESSTMFWLVTTTLLCVAYMVMLVLQFINVMIAKRRLNVLKLHFNPGRLSNVEWCVQEMEQLCNEYRIQLGNTGDKQARLQYVLVKAFTNFVKQNNVFENLTDRNEDLNQGSNDETHSIELSHIPQSTVCSEPISFENISIFVEEYISGCNDILSDAALDYLHSTLNSNSHQFDQNDRENILNLIIFIQQLKDLVQSYRYDIAQNIQYEKTVKAKTHLFYMLCMIMILFLPALYGIIHLFVKGHSVSYLESGALSLPSYLRFIFTSIYIYFLFR